jgi:hypothetical protein
MPEALIHRMIRMRRKGRERGAVHTAARWRIAGPVDHTHELAACHSERSTPQKSIVHNNARREVYQ